MIRISISYVAQKNPPVTDFKKVWGRVRLNSESTIRLNIESEKTTDFCVRIKDSFEKNVLKFQ